jgi:hypothetical protein
MAFFLQCRILNGLQIIPQLTTIVKSSASLYFLAKEVDLQDNGNYANHCIRPTLPLRTSEIWSVDLHQLAYNSPTLFSPWLAILVSNCLDGYCKAASSSKTTPFACYAA